MKRFLASAAVLLAAMPAAAQEWVPLNYMDEGTDDYRIVYLDRASVKPAGDRRAMTMAHVFAAKQRFSTGTEYDWIETTYALDCSAGTLHSTRTAAVNAGSPVTVSTNPGKEIPFASNLPMLRAAEAVCEPGGAKLRAFSQPATALGAHARQRFDDYTGITASRRSSNWARTGFGGPAGEKIALFLDRNSVISIGNLRRASLLSVSQRPGSSNFTIMRTEFDCNAGTRSQGVSESHRDGKKPIQIFPDSTPAAVTAGTIFGSIRAPLCAGDYSGTRPYLVLPEAIRATAFAP